MLTAAQEQERKTYIGASDAGTVLSWYLGVPELAPPWQQPYDVYNRLTGGERPPMDEEQAERVEWGSMLEAPIAHRYAKRTGWTLRGWKEPARLPDMPFVGALPDFQAIDAPDHRLVEVKNLRALKDIPPYYLAQGQQQMLVTGVQVLDFAILVAGQKLEIQTMEADQDYQDVLLEALSRFWDQVQAGTPPELVPGHRSTPAALRAMFPNVTSGVTQLSAKARAWHEMREKARAEIKDLEGVAEIAKQRILMEMGEAGVGLLPGGGGYTRKRVSVAGYTKTVEPYEYLDLRFSKKLGGE